MIVSNKELIEIGRIDTGEQYEFDTVIILEDPDNGKHYAGHDSGCSCPIPFEYMTDLADWTEIHSKTEAVDFAKRSLGYCHADDLASLMAQLQDTWN